MRLGEKMVTELSHSCSSFFILQIQPHPCPPAIILLSVHGFSLTGFQHLYRGPLVVSPDPALED
jgi:hypothetical protein